MLGLNGVGKSTLLRIMAGIDTEINGEARRSPAFASVICRKNPSWMLTRTRGNVEEGVAAAQSLLTRFDEVNAAFAEPMDDDQMNALLEEQGQLQDQIDAAGGWELDRKLEVAADALRLPPWDADVTRLSGESVPRRPVQIVVISA